MTGAKRSLLGVIAIAAVLSVGYRPQASVGQEPNLGGDRRPAGSVDAAVLLAALQEQFARVIARAEPSVVSVIRIKGVEARHEVGPIFPRDRIILPGRNRETSEQILNDPRYVPNDFGSGVIIGSEGLILTTYHVIRDAHEVYVRFQDGKLAGARIWAADPRSDMAVLKVPRDGLTPIEIGAAETLRKGHIVLALANPLATARDGRATASWGIIANTQRSLPPPTGPIPEEQTLHHNGTLLQTDCRLDIGSSGGALIDIHGRLVGLITALPALHGYDRPAGFAIPMDPFMRRIVARLKEGREVEYGFLGIQLDDVASARRQTLLRVPLPAEVRYGVVVVQVYEGCPAYLAGIREGDVILAIDGEPVRNSEQLIVRIGTKFAGTRVRLRIWRNARELELTVKLGKYPVQGRVIATRRPEPWRGLRVDWVSLLITELVARERLRRVADGAVLVTDVVPDSPAAKAGLEPKMLITHVNNHRVRDPDEFARAVRSATGPVELTVEGVGRVVVPPAGGGG